MRCIEFVFKGVVILLVYVFKWEKNIVKMIIVGQLLGLKLNCSTFQLVSKLIIRKILT